MSSSSTSASTSRFPVLLLQLGVVLEVGLFLEGNPVELFLLVKVGGGLAGFACAGSARRECRVGRAFCGGLIVARRSQIVSSMMGTSEADAV